MILLVLRQARPMLNSDWDGRPSKTRRSNSSGRDSKVTGDMFADMMLKDPRRVGWE